MDYYQKYLKLLNQDKIVGGSIPQADIESFRHTSNADQNFIMHYPFTWNVQNNQFYRWPFILKLIKLSQQDIYNIINNKPDYENLLNCILVTLTQDNKEKLKSLNEKEYNIYLKDKYKQTFDAQGDLKITVPQNAHVVYVRNLINYFIATHKLLNDDLIISPSQESKTIDKYQEHMYLCRDYYYNWRKCVNKFYGIKEHDGLTPRQGETENVSVIGSTATFVDTPPAPESGLFHRLQKEPAKTVINTKYHELTESNITTYLKIRCEGEEYNKRFNVYLEDEEVLLTDRTKTKPRSMYLTGPNPNHNIYYYKSNKKEDKIIPHVSEIAQQYPNLVLSTSGDKDVEDIKKYEYGNLYGPFTKIFTPKQSNKEISNNCKEILDKLKKNESVFVLGYGASGAGKTTGLIYNKVAEKEEDKNGILLNILTTDHFQHINDLDVTVHELYSTKEFGPSPPKEYNNIRFKKQTSGQYNGQFIIEPNFSVPETRYTEKVRTKIQPQRSGDPDILWNDTIYSWIITNGVFKSNDPRLVCTSTKKDDGNTVYDPNCTPDNVTARKQREIKSLGEFILATVDNIRMISPTTNNPVSSRSHVLIYIKIPHINSQNNNIIQNNQYKYLIIGDLAGVENKFTCEAENTKAQFLSLPEYDRITGKPVKQYDASQNELVNPDGSLVIKPHYTVNSTLTLKTLPNDTHSKFVLEFLGYNPDTKTVSDASDFKSKILLLAILSGVANYTENGQFNDEIKRFFDSRVAEVNRYEANYRRIDAFLQSHNIIKGSQGSYKIPISTDRNVTWALYTAINNNNFNNDFKKLTGTTEVMNQSMADALTSRLNDPDDLTKIIFDSYFTWKQQQVSTGQQALTDDKVNELITTGMSEQTFNSMPNLKQKILEKISQYYPRFSQLIKGATGYKHIIFGPDNESGLYADLLENMDLLTSSRVQERCNERRIEGKFINESLIGMSKDLSNLIQQLNSDSQLDTGLFKNIPLVKEPCFKYFCNQEHQSCFSQLEKNKDAVYNNKIVQDIKDMIDPVPAQGASAQGAPVQGVRTYENTNKLGIVVFAVLNINKKDNDPTRMPYIDVTKLKQIRDEYITYAFYYQESNPIGAFKESIKEIFGQNPTEKIWAVLVAFKEKIGPLSLKPIEIYQTLDGILERQFFDTLKELIESLDQINSLGPIGTMDFLNSLKNVYSTDIACNLIDDSANLPISYEIIKGYKNVITTELLSSYIYKQIKNNFTGNSRAIGTVELPIAPAHTSNLNSIDKILGGYMKKSKKKLQKSKS